MREDFIVPVDQQIQIPVQQELMETCQDWLRKGSAPCVTLECTVKEQVQCLKSSDPTVTYIFVTGVNGFSARLKALLGCYLFKGRTFPSGPCAEGVVCVGGASESSPVDSLGGFPCPSGFFCSAGTSVPKPCPKGTFRCTSCSICLVHNVLR